MYEKNTSFHYLLKYQKNYQSKNEHPNLLTVSLQSLIKGTQREHPAPTFSSHLLDTSVLYMHIKVLYNIWYHRTPFVLQVQVYYLVTHFGYAFETRRYNIVHKNIQIMVGQWYLFQSTQNMLRTHDGKQVFSAKSRWRAKYKDNFVWCPIYVVQVR